MIEFGMQEANMMVSILLKEYEALCRLSCDQWCLSLEHTIHVIEQDLKYLCSFEPKYQKFLHESGLSKNSYSLADGMRHLSSLDRAKDPTLFQAVVRGAIVPALQSFSDRHLPSRLGKVNLDNCVAWVPSSCSEMLSYGIMPSRYGSALMREANALYFEKMLRSISPELYARLHLHYDRFLLEKECPNGFVRFNWENQIGFHEIEKMFSDHWSEYLERIADRFDLIGASESRETILFQWSQIFKPNHLAWKLPY